MTLLRQSWLFVPLACVSLLGGCATPGQADVPPVREVAEQTVWRGKGGAADHPTPRDRQTLLVKDPYLWVYNASFAKDFGMPGKWVDNTLSGADALAFRTTESFPMCGWGGNPKACRVSSQCVLEMYFHHDRHPLPWNEALRWTEFWIKDSSTDILHTLRSLDRAESQVWTKSPFFESAKKKDLQWWYVHSSKSRSGGGPFIDLYDRTIFGSYALVVLSYGCMHAELVGLDLSFHPPNPSSSSIAFQSVVFPSQWKSRVKAAIQKVAQEDRKFFRSQLKQLGLP